MSSGSQSDEKPVVLIVDDEPNIRETFSKYLQDVTSEVRTAVGEGALDEIDDDVDVVFLDREMPGMSGEEVLEAIRDEGYDVPVSMVTGVEPERDIVDMPFDDYVVKPVSEQELQEKLRQLLHRMEYDEETRELFALTSKRHVLSEDSEDVIKSWRRKEIAAIIEDAEVAPAPGVFGGWHSGDMVIREENEKEAVEGVDRSPLPVVLERTADRRGDEPAQVYRAGANARSMSDVGQQDGDGVVTVTYEELRNTVRVLALGLDALGLEEDRPVFLLSGTRPEAMWCDLAAQVAGAPVIGADPSAGTRAVKRDDVDPAGFVVEDVDTLETIEDALIDEYADIDDVEEQMRAEIRGEVVDANVDFFVVMDELEGTYADRENVVSLKTLYDGARKAASQDRYLELIEDLSPSKTAGIHGSGETTLRLTHQNMLENAAQIYARLTTGDGAVSLDRGDRLLTSVDPSEPLGRIVNHYLGVVYVGCTAYSDSGGSLLEEMEWADPTVVAATGESASAMVETASSKAVSESSIATQGLFEWALGQAESGGGGLMMSIANLFGLGSYQSQFGSLEGVLTVPDTLEADTASRLGAADVTAFHGFVPERLGVAVAATPPDDPRYESLGVPLYDENVEIAGTEGRDQPGDSGEIGEFCIKGLNVPSEPWNEGATVPKTDDDHVKTGEIVEWDNDDYIVPQS